MAEKKNIQIEYIRAIAAIGVVAIHTVYSGILYGGNKPDAFVVLFFTMIKNLLYWAVPCFGMISGILLLNPTKELNVKKIYGKYLLRICAVLLLFGSVFSWMELIFSDKKVSLSQIPKAVLLVLKYQTWEHLWYLYALISVYLILPLWRLIVKKSNNKVLLCVICAVYLLTVIFNSREISLHLFFLMGEFFRRKIFIPEKRKAIIGIFFTSAIILFIVYIHEVYHIDIDRLMGYTSFLVAFQAYFIFLCLFETDYTKLNNGVSVILKHISINSFGIYIVHMFFVNMEYKVVKLHLMNSLLSLFIFFGLIILNVMFSYLGTEIIKKIPIIKRVI